MSNIISFDTLKREDVKNPEGKDLGNVVDFMVDTDTGRVEYSVISFGGFMGLGDKLFAVPLEAMELDRDNKCFVLDADKERLENAPGFDKDNWPTTADSTFIENIHSHYGTRPALRRAA